MKYIYLFVIAILMQSCSTNLLDNLGQSNNDKKLANSQDYSTPTVQLNKTRELLDGASINFPTLSATSSHYLSLNQRWEELFLTYKEVCICKTKF